MKKDRTAKLVREGHDIMAAEYKRMIDDRFLKALSGDGPLSPVVRLVKDKSSGLILAFRKSYISVYFRGHSLYKIEQNKKSYRVSFNFNHARYSESYKQDLDDLVGLGMSKTKRKGLSDYENIELYKNIPCNGTPDTDFWEKSSMLFEQLINDFFDANKTHDYFMTGNHEDQENIHNKLNKRLYCEKQRQQVIALANQHTDDGYFIYDIEYTEPENKNGRFDMLAVKVESGCAAELVLIELKSTESACNGKCGIESHRKKLNNYINCSSNTNARRNDAGDILTAFSSLFGFEQIKTDRINRIPVSYIFVFTDKAKKYFGKAGENGFILNAPWNLSLMEPIR